MKSKQLLNTYLKPYRSKKASSQMPHTSNVYPIEFYTFRIMRL